MPANSIAGYQSSKYIPISEPISSYRLTPTLQESILLTSNPDVTYSNYQMYENLEDQETIYDDVCDYSFLSTSNDDERIQSIWPPQIWSQHDKKSISSDLIGDKQIYDCNYGQIEWSLVRLNDETREMLDNHALKCMREVSAL